MKVIFFWYSDIIKKKYWCNKEFIFFDNSGFWIKDDKDQQRTLVDVSNYNNLSETVNEIDLIEINKELRLFLPVFIRNNSRGDTYELVLKKATVQIIQVYNFLKTLNKKTDFAIFHTSVSHHLDTFICDLACKYSKFKKIFLYCEIFSSRLLPITQNESLADRQSINFRISDYTYDQSIDDFIENIKKNKFPKNNALIPSINKSFLYHFSLLIFYLYPKKIISFVKKIIFVIFLNNKNKYNNIFLYTFKNYFFQDIIQFFEQKSAIKFYKKNSKINNFDKINNINLLLIASYQPEATSFPEGHNYGNHIDIIIKIRQLGYNNKIFYKEHPGAAMYNFFLTPSQVSIFRSIDYYQQLINFNCSLLDLDFKIDFKDKFLPITISGTVALERALLGLHTIVAGRPWFIDLPGIIKLSDLNSLTEIDINLVVPDQALAVRAKQFLLNKLNNKTILNVPGIGNARPIKNTNPNLLNIFFSEIDNLINNINK